MDIESCDPTFETAGVIAGHGLDIMYGIFSRGAGLYDERVRCRRCRGVWSTKATGRVSRDSVSQKPHADVADIMLPTIVTMKLEDAKAK